MSGLNFDSSFDDEWDGDEPNDLGWDEADWYKYLQRQDQEITRFLAIYDQIDPKMDRIDEAARLMGWEPSSQEFPTSSIDLDRQDDEDRLPPYTLHQHPVFIITRAFHSYLTQSWDYIRTTYPENKMLNVFSWYYAQSLNLWERNILLALQALDIGDFALSICHIKYALNAFNQTMHLLGKLPETPNPEYLNRIHECRTRLFDLREICLRIINDCREEIRHQKDERD